MTGLDDLSTGRYSCHLARPDVEFALGSVLNADLVADLVSRNDVVFHLAAAIPAG